MHNPLVTDLSQYNINELEDRVQDLQRKYFQTSNPGLQSQVANMIDIYREELQTRRAIEAQRQREQQDDDNSLDNLINVS
jgi:hypothetical protein